MEFKMLCENVVQVYWQPNYFLVSVSRFEMPKRNQRILTEEITETQKCYSLFHFSLEAMNLMGDWQKKNQLFRLKQFRPNVEAKINPFH
jgi:hypothetical protein